MSLKDTELREYPKLMLLYGELAFLGFNELCSFGIVVFTLEVSSKLIYESSTMSEVVQNFVALVIISELDEVLGPMFLQVCNFGIDERLPKACVARIHKGRWHAERVD